MKYMPTSHFGFLSFVPSKIWVIILLLIFRTTLFAQEDHFWAFGANAGIDFNTDPPTPLSTQMRTNEGSSSVCDDRGQLLFYTDGTSVWDRNDNLMPNGSDLPGTIINITASTSQGALIVPVPGNLDRYYVFSMGSWERRPLYFGRLSYSIVDMSLNNGLGDVIASRKAILLDTLLTEHMTAVSSNDCGAWLIVVSRQNNNFKAYYIGTDSINHQPVISKGIPGKELKFFHEISGTIDIAPSRDKLAIAQDKVILYDFDPDSGKITHPIILDTCTAPPASRDLSTFYGICFSPDNTRLYASLLEVPAGEIVGVYQYDLSSGDSVAMVNSKTLISKGRAGAIKRGPDGKLYLTSGGAYSLHVIEQPNLAGTGCQYVVNGFTLLSSSIYGLPNLGTLLRQKTMYSVTIDSTLCSGPRSLKTKYISGESYIWNDSTLGPTRITDSPGVYWVRYKVPVNSGCKYEYHVDTFKVIFHITTKNIYTNTVAAGMCKNDTLLLQALNLNGINYTWENGSKEKQRAINQRGTHWISYRVDSLCEHYVDSFIVTYPQKDYQVSFDTDTLVCQNNLIYFQNTSDEHFNNFTWTFGNGDSSVSRNMQYTWMQAGSYQVALIGYIGEICPDTAYRIIIVDSILSGDFLMQPKSICMGERVTISPQTDSTVHMLHWQFGDGIEMSSGNESVVHHAYDTEGIITVTLNTKFRACPDALFTDTVYVYPLPKVSLGTDTVLCLGGAPVTLKNREMPPLATYRSLWNTGDTTESIKAVHPGTYSLTIHTEPAGCSTTEYITVHKGCYIDIPNAFTPNGNGENDYFSPRQLLSQTVTAFRMQIFNRWGQLIFETKDRNGRGWDGMFNGKEQPTGVYVYLIEAEVNGTRKEYYQGNISLIR